MQIWLFETHIEISKGKKFLIAADPLRTQALINTDSNVQVSLKPKAHSPTAPSISCCCVLLMNSESRHTTKKKKNAKQDLDSASTTAKGNGNANSLWLTKYLSTHQALPLSPEPCAIFFSRFVFVFLFFNVNVSQCAPSCFFVHIFQYFFVVALGFVFCAFCLLFVMGRISHFHTLSSAKRKIRMLHAVENIRHAKECIFSYPFLHRRPSEKVWFIGCRMLRNF